MLGRELFARPLLFTQTPRFIVMIWSSSSSQPLRAPCAWCAVWLHGYMCVCVCVNNINWLVIILHRVCVFVSFEKWTSQCARTQSVCETNHTDSCGSPSQQLPSLHMNKHGDVLLGQQTQSPGIGYGLCVNMHSRSRAEPVSSGIKLWLAIFVYGHRTHERCTEVCYITKGLPNR